jgi:hypothetical protein
MVSDVRKAALRFERPRYAPSTTKADWISYSERLEAALRAILAVRLDESLPMEQAVREARMAMRQIAEEALRGG